MNSKFSIYAVWEQIVVVATLVGVAYITLAERKIMGINQRREGPNKTGDEGKWQAFADALKLILKEIILPTVATGVFLFNLGSFISLLAPIVSFLVVPYGPGITISDSHLGLLYLLCISTLGAYGILIGGWAGNSKYTFLGAIRSLAQILSYELIISTSVLFNTATTGSLNLTEIVENQKKVWNIFPLYPAFKFFSIGALAETNRTPFDLAEAESELVSGYMTEHSAVVFVFFFLGEYTSIALMCLLGTILYLGGYLIPELLKKLKVFIQEIRTKIVQKLISIILNGITMGLKASIYIFYFILARVGMPRQRFDKLMSECWTTYLPILFALIIVYLIYMVSLDSTPGVISSFMPFVCMVWRPYHKSCHLQPKTPGLLWHI